MPICSYFRGERPHLYFFLLNVFEHKIEVIMSWQICREVLNAHVDPEHQIVTAFLRTSFEIKNRLFTSRDFQFKAGESYM